MGKLRALDPNEAYQLDGRLRLGMGVKAAGVGGKTLSAGAREECWVAAWVGWRAGRLCLCLCLVG